MRKYFIVFFLLLTVLFVSLAFTGDGRAYPRIYAGSQCESYYYSDREYMSRSNGRIENGKTRLP